MKPTTSTGGKMDINNFLALPEVANTLEEAFVVLAEAGDTFNVSETMTNGYYSHVTIVDQDETGKSFSKTLKLSKIGAGHISAGYAALHILSTLYCLANQGQIVVDFDDAHYYNLLGSALNGVKNKGFADVTFE
jgi:hypothetical protein